MAYSPEKERKALQRFLTIHKLSQRELCSASGLSPAVIAQFLNGRTHSLTAKTIDALAAGAAKLLGREVTAAELRGLVVIEVEVPVRSYVGAGDEIFPIDGGEPIDYVTAPPGMEAAEATEVRGRSMLPLYHDGDVLFHVRVDTDAGQYRGEVVVAQILNGKRYVKLLQAGSKRGRFTLESVNPAFAPIEDQQLAWVGPIEWVKKRRRK